MARRRPGVPHVMAYWWKSPSSARCAASMTARGGGKFGIPWARLTPPCWATTRVISRMTDSVNPWTRREIGMRLAGYPPAMAGTIATSSPSFSLVALLSRKRMSSWFT